VSTIVIPSISLDQLYRLHTPFVIAFLTVVVIFVIAGSLARR
jgi:hypothetical protein